MKEEISEKPLHISAEALLECSLRTKELIDLAVAERNKEIEEELLKCVTAKNKDCYFLRVSKDSPIFLRQNNK